VSLAGTGRRAGLTVLKLGGSLARSEALPSLLAGIGACRAPLVVVAGGGPFADAVRHSQRRLGFGDGAAHRMALLAMAQFAEALAGIEPRLRIAPDVETMRAWLADGLIPVWSPWPPADGVEDLPESWQLTSDSLAAWLTEQLSASRLLLLKSCALPPDCATPRQAAEGGLVDPLFPAYADRCRAAIVWVGPSHHARLPSIIDGGADAGPRLAPEMTAPLLAGGSHGR
jgi:dihydroneopterin aldolase